MSLNFNWCKKVVNKYHYVCECCGEDFITEKERTRTKFVYTNRDPYTLPTKVANKFGMCCDKCVVAYQNIARVKVVEKFLDKGRKSD